MTDTAPTDKVDPSTVEGYEPPIDGETSKAKRARRARNRRRAEKHQRETAAASTTGPTSTPVGRPSRASKREGAVLGILTLAGVGVMAVDEFDGVTIIEGAPDLAKALADLAEKNPRVARALDSLTETSAWAQVATAAAGIALPIIRHHATRRPDLDVEGAASDPAPPSTPEPPEAAPQVDPTAPVFTVRDDTDAADPVPTFRAMAG